MGEAEDWIPATSGEESLLPEEWAEDWGWEDDTTSWSESEAAKTENHCGGSGAVGWTPGEDTGVSNVEISFKANLSEGALHELRTVLETCRAKYQVQDALSSTGVRLRRGGGECAVANCPFPTHSLRSPSLHIDLANPKRFWCEACGVSGDIFDYVGALHGVAFLSGQFELLTGRPLWTHVAPEYAEEVKEVTRLSRREEIEGLDAADGVASGVYQALLNRLSLYETHRAYLLNCGLTVESCELNEYRSLPPSVEERVAVAEDLVADGYDLEAVNGFFRLPDDAPDVDLRARWCFGGNQWGRREVGGGIGPGDISYTVSGIIVPVRERNGQVVQLVVENARPPLTAPSRVKNTWPPSASILTSYRRAGVPGSGPSGGARLHYAGMVDDAGNQYPDGLWLAEGVLLADVIAGELQARAVGVPSCGQLVDEVLREARLYRQLYVVPDGRESRHVEKVCREAETQGLEAYVASWDLSNIRDFNNRPRGEGESLEWVISFQSWLYGSI